MKVSSEASGEGETNLCSDIVKEEGILED